MSKKKKEEKEIMDDLINEMDFGDSDSEEEFGDDIKEYDDGNFLNYIQI